MILRIVSILFPMFAIVTVGYVYGRYRGRGQDEHGQPDMALINRLNMDVFLPALVFAALAVKSFDPNAYRDLAVGVLAVIVGSGLIAWPLSRLAEAAPKTFVPPMMFNNCGNLGLPLAVLAFGEAALAPAVAMFVISNVLHFSFGAWLLDHKVRFFELWRIPSVLAAFAGLAVGLMQWELWPPLMVGLRMLGEVSIPLLLFSLGVRLAGSDLGYWRAGLVGAVLRPVTGMAIAAGAGWLLALDAQQQAMLFVFGALPPAVLNYMFAERYHQEPEKVAAIVMIGNLAALVFLPLALALSI